MPHIHEKVDHTTEVFVVHENRVLLRMHDKYKMWLGVGGHVELDEDPAQAAVRECKEEIGLDIAIIPTPMEFAGNVIKTSDTELPAPQFMNRHRINETHEHVTMIYFATSKTNSAKDLEGIVGEEGLHWFTEKELDDPFFGIAANIIGYAKAALKTANTEN